MTDEQRLFRADGAGSSAIFRSLTSILDERRTELGSDRATALYRPTGTVNGYVVLADSCSENLEPALGNEYLRVNRPIDLTEPSTVSSLEGSSTLRDLTLTWASGVAVP